MALAMPTLCCSPPESWEGKASSLSKRPTILRAPENPFVYFPVAHSESPKTKATLSKTFCCGSSLKSWKTIPMRLLKYGILLSGSLLRQHRQLKPALW